MKNIGMVFLIAILSACASKPTASISKIPVDSLTVAEVRANPGRFVGSEVRWGGVITRVENKASETWIELVGRELRKDGEPKLGGPSDGRFIASFPGFADAMVYKEGYLLTVVGTLKGETTRLIGEYEYRFPVVSVTGSYLWKVEEKPRFPDYPSPLWYDPWPFYPHPYPLHPH